MSNFLTLLQKTCLHTSLHPLLGTLARGDGAWRVGFVKQGMAKLCI